MGKSKILSQFLLLLSPEELKQIRSCSERVKAKICANKQLALTQILLETRDHTKALQLLKKVLALTSHYEILLERMIALEQLQFLARMMGDEKQREHWKSEFRLTRGQLFIIDTAEELHYLAQRGLLKQVEHKQGQLKWFAKEVKSHVAMFMLMGVEAKVAEQKGKYEIALRYLKQQMALVTKHPAVRSSEREAQVLAGLAWNAVQRKRYRIALGFARNGLKLKLVFPEDLVRLKKAERTSLKMSVKTKR